MPGCFHIIVRHSSMRSGPALKRCYRSRKTAETVQGHGAQPETAPITTSTLARHSALSLATMLTTASAPNGRRVITPKPSQSNQLGA